MSLDHKMSVLGQSIKKNSVALMNAFIEKKIKKEDFFWIQFL